MNLFSAIQSINDRISKVTKFLMVSILLILLAVMTINVVLRYVFSYSLSWGEELGGISLVWIVFLGGGMVARKGNNLSIETIYMYLPKTGKYIIDLLIFLSTFFVGIVLIYFSIIQIHSFYINHQVFTASKFPVYIAYSVIPFGFLLIVLGTLELFLKKYYFVKENK